MNGQECGLSGVGRPQGQAFAADVLERTDVAIGPRYDDGGESSIHVAHGQGPAAALGPEMNLHPSQVRVPGDVNRAVEQSLHLAVIVGEEDVVDRWTDFAEILTHPFPAWNYSWIVGDRAHQNRFFHVAPQNKGMPKRVRPMNS